MWRASRSGCPACDVLWWSRRGWAWAKPHNWLARHPSLKSCHFNGLRSVALVEMCLQSL